MFMWFLFYLYNIQKVFVSEKVLKIFLRGLCIDNRHILPAIEKEMGTFLQKAKKQKQNSYEMFGVP